MANFCTKCGRKLEEGEVCNCVNEGTQSENTQKESNIQSNDVQQQVQNTENQYYQQNQTNGNQYDQQNQANEGQNYQQPNQNQQYYQGQPNQGRTKEAEWFNEKKDAFVSGTKNMFSEILPILKAPVTEIKNIVSGNSAAVGLEFIVAKGVIALIMILIALAKISSMTGGFIEIPYFKIIILVLLITVGADFLEALLMKVITGLFNGVTNVNAMLTTVGARALYESIIFVVVGILSLINLNFAIMIYAVLAIILTCIQYSGYQAVTQVDEDKKPYVFFVAKACMAVIIGIVVYLMAKDILTTVIGGFGIFNNFLY